MIYSNDVNNPWIAPLWLAIASLAPIVFAAVMGPSRTMGRLRNLAAVRAESTGNVRTNMDGAVLQFALRLRAQVRIGGYWAAAGVSAAFFLVAAFLSALYASAPSQHSREVGGQIVRADSAVGSIEALGGNLREVLGPNVPWVLGAAGVSLLAFAVLQVIRLRCLEKIYRNPSHVPSKRVRSLLLDVKELQEFWVLSDYTKRTVRDFSAAQVRESSANSVTPKRRSNKKFGSRTEL